MTNEEAFKEELSLFRKYAYEFGQSNDIETFELMMKCQVNLHTLYGAAIAYMQEQSEPVGRINQFPKVDGNLYKRADITWSKVSDGDKLYTTPQIQQPLKRLSYDQVEALYDGGSWHDFANAIMEKMQELNK